MIYLPVRSITAEAAKNRTIPPSSKTVNSQTAKNSTKPNNNLKYKDFYFKSKQQRSSEIPFRRPYVIQSRIIFYQSCSFRKYSGLTLNQDKATKPQTVQIVRQGEATPYWFKETFAKFLFPRQPKPKHRFSSISAPNYS